MKTKSLIFALIVIFSQAIKAEVWCSGTIDAVFIEKNGDVSVHPSWRNDYVGLCNLKTNANNIDTVTCSMWSSYAAQAVEARLQTVMYYSGASSCPTMPTYSSTPATGYLMLRPKQ